MQKRNSARWFVATMIASVPAYAQPTTQQQTDPQQTGDAQSAEQRAAPPGATPPSSTTPSPATAEAPTPAASAPESPVPESATAPSATRAESGAAPGDETELRELEQELAQQLGAAPDGTAQTAPPDVQPGQSSVRANLGLSNAMNPALSGTLSVLGGGSSRVLEPDAQDGDAEEHDETGDLQSGVALQEVELRFSAVVDPYFRADITFAGSTDELGFEEAYLSTVALPWVTLRAGQMRAEFGRHNPLHTHAFPFLTAPLPWRRTLGAEGLSDPGVSVEVLLPLPFFAELKLQAFQGEWPVFAGGVADDPDTSADESVADARRPADLAYLGRLETLFELGSPSTLHLGGSYLAGRNGFSRLSSVAGADVTLKWRPLHAERYVGLEWTTEYLWFDRQGTPAGLAIDATGDGAYSGLRLQFLRRYWGQVRGALSGVAIGSDERVFRGEALLAFVPSEFSLLRLQYAYESSPVESRPIHELFLQITASIGSHPAHTY